MISCLSLALDLVLALQTRVPTENASPCADTAHAVERT